MNPVRHLSRLTLATLAVLLCTSAPAYAGQIKAGAASVDASWHVGASAGQYATKKTSDPEYDAEFDPNVQSFKNQPSYGIQSALEVRALVVQGADGKTVAMAKTDLYIPQDLLWRRAAQILEARTGGKIGQSNLTMAITHDHSSPYYSSTAAGAWAFQDVFDVRFYNYYARKIADAVQKAYNDMKPARMGASVTTLDDLQRNVPGPQTANNGTPAGYPSTYGDHKVSVVRFDTLEGKPIGNLVTYSLHGESLDGNDLVSADWVGPFQRMLDRETGGVTVYMQSAVGNSETEENATHDVHQRLFFEHKQFAQTERSGRLLADAAARTWRRIGEGARDPDADNAPHFVPMASDHVIDEIDRWFFGPVSHPLPTVSNCRTDTTLGGNPQVPIVGVPDCGSAVGKFGAPAKPPFSLPFDPGLNAESLAARGIPVPANYGAPSYGGLEESLGIHLQVVRLGPVVLTMCSCEQWADQAQNVRTRTDKVAGNEWLGYDWADPDRPGNDGSRGCFPNDDGTHNANGTGTGTWNCPDPQTACTVNTAGQRTCRSATQNGRIAKIRDHDYQVMEAQILNPADGWNDPDCLEVGCGLQAESEPDDPAKIRGGYTHDDTNVRSPGHSQSADFADRYGYTLTIPIAMANDYNGYIATLREYQRGDHYRKALTAWGPHSSDYMATHLTQMARALAGHGPSRDQVDAESDPAKADPRYGPAASKQVADRAFNEAKAQALGNSGEQAAAAYQASLPDDGGEAGVAEQPKDLQRFGPAFMSWIGGDNYTDMPSVRVERQGADGRWTEFADQSGELPVTLKLPQVAPDSGPAYLSGGQVWKWTATFETFVSRYDLGDRPQATPPGTYRFRVNGLRQRNHAQVPYSLTSREVLVGAWSGLQANDLRAAGDGTVSFVVGPITPRAIPGANPAATAAIGPIDYPDSDAAAANAHGVRYVKDVKSLVRDPQAPGDPTQFEWYCLACSFRPWADFGTATKATVTFAKTATSSGKASAAAAAPTRVAATLVKTDVPGCPPSPLPGVSLCDRWKTSRALAEGESAYVCPGDLQDGFGNYNGEISDAATAPGATVALDCRPLDQLVPGPVVGSAKTAPDPFFGRSDGPGGVGPGETGPASALGLPHSKACRTRRSFKIRIRSPKRGVRLRRATVSVNGHRVRTLRGKRIRAVINLRGLPRGRYTVKITVTTTKGKRYSATRTYHTCVRKARPHKTKRKNRL
jgi:hypothetical protein